MSKEAAIGYFRIRLSERDTVTRSVISDEVRKGPFGYSEEEKEEIIEALEYLFEITQSSGNSVRIEHEPWLAKRRNENDFEQHYWPRLKRYFLSENRLPPSVVGTLDRVSDEILDYCGDPADISGWTRRGLVLGHVQSGKTTNYSALICKAADAGYKIVILLAGITNSLRAQTQERLDEYFIGKESVFNAMHRRDMPIIHHCTSTPRYPVFGTSRDEDFKKDIANNYGVTLQALNEPIIFVTKKNKNSLSRLLAWIQEQQRGDKLQYPLLLIDDEADNASINTAKDPGKTSTINALVRHILSCFSRSTYVGYTATPFANIFIDPHSEQEMLEDDLFPRDFIKTLDPPTNYLGANRIFSDSADMSERMVIEISDHESLLPLKHKKDLAITKLPDSLYEAVRIFILTRAIRICRGQGSQHCSMMINVSRFNDVQDKVHGEVYKYLQQLKYAIEVNINDPELRKKDPDASQLTRDFKHEFADVDISESEVMEALPEAVGSIQTMTVNMRGGDLNYRTHDGTGLHVIAVGGLALSRGLTLEGLTVSYVLRNASASDTLMQMARWFGYRSGYEDICRLYLPDISIGHYRYITEAIDELRLELKRMQSLDRSPKDFGLRVRHSPAAIRITAANKMKDATKLTVAQDYSNRHVEGYVLDNDQKTNERNLALIKSLLTAIGEPHRRIGNAYYWSNILGSEILPIIREFSFSSGSHADLSSIMGDTSLFEDYVFARAHAECASWDVAVPYSSRGREVEDFIPNHVLPVREHKTGKLIDGDYYVTRKQKVANPGDETIGLDEEARAKAAKEAGDDRPKAFHYIRQRERPLMLVHVFDAGISSGEEGEGFQLEGIVASLSFCMPGTSLAPESKEYQVNKIYREHFFSLGEDPDDDEVIIDES